MSYSERLETVRLRIEAACRRSNRNPDDVQLIAVTKYSSLDETKRLIEAGCNHLAESRMQDALPKMAAMDSNDITWHFIGHLQTNKVKHLMPGFSYLHSLDRISLAEELNRRYEGESIPCFLQVNISGEDTKFGISPESLLEFVHKMKQYPVVNICGLMTMAPRASNEEETRMIFRGLRQWQTRLQEDTYLGKSCRFLSMGMSNDYEIAIEEGATHIRLGSVLTK